MGVVKCEWGSQAKDVLLSLQGEPGPPGIGVQGPQVSLQPYLCLPTDPTPPNNTATSQLSTPTYSENHKALPSHKCSRAQLWHRVVQQS